jgi:hypothetical protein
MLTNAFTLQNVLIYRHLFSEYQSEYIEGKIKSTFVCHQTNKIIFFKSHPRNED